jgi:hypothetical protein
MRTPRCPPGARHRAGPMARPVDEGAPTGRSGPETDPFTRDPSRTNRASAKPPALDDERAIAMGPLDHIRSAPRRHIGRIDPATPDLMAICFGLMVPMRAAAIVLRRLLLPLRCILLEWLILLRRVSWQSRGRWGRLRIELRCGGIFGWWKGRRIRRRHRWPKRWGQLLRRIAGLRRRDTRSRGLRKTRLGEHQDWTQNDASKSRSDL